jgi:hypothetical protein
MCQHCKALFDEEVDGDVEGQLFVCIGLIVELCRCKDAMRDTCAQNMPNYRQIKIN